MTDKLDWLQYHNPWMKIARDLDRGKLVPLETEQLYNTHRVEPVYDLAEAEVVTSQVQGSDVHKLILDIDLPAALISSTTPGHHHLYIDKELSWEETCEVLEVLAKVGIVQKGYVEASKARGFTALRTPWTRK